MKKLIILNLLIALMLSTNAQERLIFSENFDGSTKPSGWSEEKVIGQGGSPSGSTVSWEYTHGGYYDYPENPYQGTRNAMFQLESDNGETTKLITPAIDLSDVLKPELRFAHVQQIWEYEGTDYWDRLKIYYKRGIDSSWVLLEAYENAVSDWIDRSVLLPDSSKSSTYYIAFEGITGFGYGSCIDTMRIMETGIEAKYLDTYSINQAATNFIPTNTFKNQILYINFNVKGNDGNLFLDSLKVTSLNTDDNNIANNGVKLYATSDSIFRDPVLIASGLNFTDGVAHFKNIGYDLPRGNTTVWITYDIASATNHDIHNNIADAKIEEEGIYINGYGYPFSDKSPEGNRLIKEALFNDSFETDLLWTFNGSFERAIPLGLGESFPGNPDPDSAYNGSFIIGTDLTTDGAYSNDLTNRQDSAISPNFDCLYYKDVTLYFARWLNLEYWDEAYIDISTDNKNSWTDYWTNSGAIIDDSWSAKSYVLDDADFKENVSIRFSLGPTNDVNQYTGWNIDDFIIIGDFISKDVGITGITLPETGCGHTSSDDVKVYIENYAGEITPSSIPLRYSIDGSEDYVIDTLFSSIEIGDSALFTFSVGADLSAPGFHTITVKTLLSGDEIPGNDSKSITIFSYPTLSLPYSENFETNNGYYLQGGTNSSWEYGEPAGSVINSAASGVNAWVTNLDGAYSSNDSSFLESPCFNFAESDSIVFEFKCKGLSEDKTDGLTLLYSTDEGTTWNLVSDDNDFYWNWYNETLISELELPGIDTTDGEWLTFRQLLPPVLSDQSTVKFRFAFESNESTNEEGFGIDDIKIYDVPYDVGVSSLSEPVTQCELSDATQVKVYIENHGITNVVAGTKIPLKLNFESEIINDTLILASDLTVDDSVLFTFNSTVDMSYAGDYDFTIYTKLESDPYFYNNTVCNDSLVTMVSVTGMPRYNPFPDQIGDNPIDTFLVAGAGYISYDWIRPVLPDTTTLTTDTLLAKNEGWYKVTVTNGVGCTAIDSVEVVNSDIDLAMDSLYTELEDSCHRNALTELSVHYINKSINLLAVDDTILLGYQINNNPVVQDTMFITVEVAVDDTAWFVYNEKADLREPGPYTIKVFTNFLRDLNHADDTVTKTVNTNGYVDIELNYDTVYSSQADTLEIIATSGYANYSWIPAETNDTISPINNVSQWYKVTVTDTYACGEDSDSAYVETYDFGINSIINPVSDCEFTTTEPIQISVHNYSGNTYTTGTKIPFKYNFDNGGWVNDTATLSSNFDPDTDKTLTITNTIDPSTLGDHSLVVMVNAEQDANPTNDTYNHSFETWGYPDVDLAYDTIFTTQADTVVLIAQDGFASYDWSDGVTTNDSLVVTDNFSAKYIVTVTDEHSCGSSKDSTQIITYNVGINELVSPESDCEHTSSENVIVSVKNYSQDILLTGTVIPVGYILEGEAPVEENYTLLSDLNPSGIVNVTFAAKVDVEEIKTHKFKLYTAFNLDVAASNDILVDAIKTFGYPVVDLGDDIYTTEPETVVLTATAGYNNYIWNDGTNTNTLSVTYTASKLYSVIVTNINGCATSDEVNIYTYNVAADSLAAPISQCELSSTETVRIGVINTSKDTLQIGEPLEVGYRLNSGSYVSESFTLSEILYPDSLEFFTLGATADLSVNQLHQFKLFAKLTNIDVLLTDTATASVDFLANEFDLGTDVTTSNATYTIDAGAGYAGYEWFDESVDQYYIVDINYQTPNHYYTVTVTDDQGCEASDSLMVTFNMTQDLGVVDLLSPVSECWQSEKTYQVQITIENLGAINISSGTPVNIGYKIDNGTPVIEDTILNSALNAGDTYDFTFSDNIVFDAANVYEFKPFVKLGGDEDAVNDTLLTNNTVDISQPDVDLGSDTVKFNDSYEITTSGTYSNYEWSTGAADDGKTSIIITETGTYSVTVTDGNGCQGSDSIYCEKLTGIENLIQGNGYSITYYPNPVNDELKIDIVNSESKDLYLELINIQGQVIYNKKYSNTQNSIERIDVNPYAKGVYYIQFRIDDEFYVRKIIIQ